MLMQVAAHRYKIRYEFVNFSFQLVAVGYGYDSSLSAEKEFATQESDSFSYYTR